MSPVIVPACDRNVDNAREMGNGSASFLSCAIGSTKQCCPAVLMLRWLSWILLLRAEGSTIMKTRLCDGKGDCYFFKHDPWFAFRIFALSEEHVRNDVGRCLSIHVIPAAWTVRAESFEFEVDVVCSVPLSIIDGYQLKSGR